MADADPIASERTGQALRRGIVEVSGEKRRTVAARRADAAGGGQGADGPVIDATAGFLLNDDSLDEGAL